MGVMNAHWIAILSNGERIEENTGIWGVIPGERKPWVRLCEYMKERGLTLQSLEVMTDSGRVMLPIGMTRFGMEHFPPKFYSLQYHVELDDLLGTPEQSDFIDLAAHYRHFVVHYILDLESGQSWVTVSQSFDAMAPTP